MKPNTNETLGGAAGVVVAAAAFAGAYANGTPLPPETAVVFAAVGPVVTWLVRLFRSRTKRPTAKQFEDLRELVLTLLEKTDK